MLRRCLTSAKTRDAVSGRCREGTHRVAALGDRDTRVGIGEPEGGVAHRHCGQERGVPRWRTSRSAMERRNYDFRRRELFVGWAMESGAASSGRKETKTDADASYPVSAALTAWLEWRFPSRTPQPGSHTMMPLSRRSGAARVRKRTCRTCCPTPRRSIATAIRKAASVDVGQAGQQQASNTISALALEILGKHWSGWWDSNPRLGKKA